MAENTSISWTSHSWNPWIGCSKVSPGCKFCYAQAYAEKYNIARWGDNNPRYLTADSNWQKPIAWQKRAVKEKTRYRVFPSLCDVFEDNPQLIQWRLRLFNLILRTPNLDWLLLTKRPENYEKLFPIEWKNFFPTNIWLGMSICTQSEYDRFFSIQKQFQQQWGVNISFISFEPLLQNIILKQGAPDWSIIGGESGFLKNARSMDLTWVRSIISQIRAMSDKPHYIFFKQMGSHLAKKLNMRDKKGEYGIDELPPAYNWLKLREIPDYNTIQKQTQNKQQLQLCL